MKTKTGALQFLWSASRLSAIAGAAAAATVGGVESAYAQAATRDEEIVVTAQKRAQNVNEIPLAISAFTAEALDRSGVTNTRDLQLVTPGLAFTQAAYAPQPSIRGIGARGVGAGDEQVVPIYIDGAYQSFLLGGIFELNNIERIEVLKGPQGTILGRNATGGAVNIITKDPVQGFEGALTAGYGSFNEVRAEGYLSGGSDKIGANLSIQYLGDDGYVEERVSGKDIAEVDSLSIRSKLVFRPSDDTTIKFGLNWAERDDNAPGALYGYNRNARYYFPPFNGRPVANGSREVYLTAVPVVELRDKSATMTVEQELGFATLTSITGVSEGRLYTALDQDHTNNTFGPLPNLALFVDQRDESITEDVYLASKGDGPFSWIVGGFALLNKAKQDPVLLPGLAPRRVFKTNTEAYAAYLQGDYEFSTGTTVSVGARYSHDRKCAFNPAAFPRTCNNFSRVNPTVSIRQQLGEDTSVYARYATAFKSGVYNVTNPRPVRPEDVQQFEIGVKSDVTPWLFVEAAFYHTDYSDLQQTSRTPAPELAVLILNAADATIQGFEGDIRIAASDRLNLRAGFSLLDHQYDSFTNAQGYSRNPGSGGNTVFFFDASGKPLVRVPDTMATLAADYTAPLHGGHLTMAANATYMGEFNWTFEGRVQQPSSTFVNGTLTWMPESERFKLQVWGKNLTDEYVPLSVTVSTLGDATQDVRPLTVGVSGTINF
jgi:iron complex outermembrane receptor protein